MPGTPPTSPRHGAPRYADGDAASFSAQVNAITDRFDITAARFESGLLTNRPSTGTGIVDRYYFATDDTSGGPSGTLYRDAGGASPTWQRLTPANAEAAFSTWRDKTLGTCLPGSGIVTSGASVYIFPPGFSGPSAVGAAGTGDYSFYFDPADYTAGTRQTKIRMRWLLTTGIIAPGVTFSPGLYPVATYAAASGVQMSVSSVGAVVTGSTATFTTPAVGTTVNGPLTEINAPAAGDYVFGFAVSGAMAAGSQCRLHAQLQYRQV